MICRRAITLLGLLRWLLALATGVSLFCYLVVPPLSAFTGRLQLAAAVEAGDARAVITLLNRGADPNTETDDPYSQRPLTVLMLAASRGHTTVVKALLAHGAAVNAIRAGDTALTLALGRGHPETVRVLLAHGADACLRARAD